MDHKCHRCGEWDGTFLPGDITGNGTVDLEDAALLLLYCQGKLDPDSLPLAAADVDQDGIVSIIDAYRIVLYYRESIAAFPTP